MRRWRARVRLGVGHCLLAGWLVECGLQRDSQSEWVWHLQACFSFFCHRLTPFPLFFPLLVPFHFLCGLTSRPPSFFSSPREVRRTQRAGGNHSPTNKPAAESGMASGGRSILAVTAPLGNGCADKRRHAGRHLLASAHRVLQRELCSVRTKIHCKSLLLVLAVLPTTCAPEEGRFVLYRTPTLGRKLAQGARETRHFPFARPRRTIGRVALLLADRLTEAAGAG